MVVSPILYDFYNYGPQDREFSLLFTEFLQVCTLPWDGFLLTLNKKCSLMASSHSFGLLIVLYGRALRFLGHYYFLSEWRIRRRPPPPPPRGTWRRGHPSLKLLRVLLFSSTHVYQASDVFKLYYIHVSSLQFLLLFLLWDSRVSHILCFLYFTLGSKEFSSIFYQYTTYTWLLF